ncbi:MAG: hypothetical protein JWO63_1411 [Frankiales bacterium]|jgi:uncharacterized protein YndB with AHSA1/START domain|nr:hypothetical protein [Frankiales bacterium]
MIDSTGDIRQHVTVDVDPQTAFDLFTAHMTEWWPAHHHIGSAPIEQIIIEPRPGGRWYTRHVDGTETSTGYVRVWEPPSRLVITWQISADWSYDTALVTLVELTFTPQDEHRTLVELVHRDLDNYGPDTDRIRAMLDEPDAWAATLSSFAARVAVSA